ncbi:MAG: T9SS type A sorting domain-containing protein [Flavobacteriales bacterium]|nr:T9SS type A sorting domain-containing protein [Flavobacteriales bacterium]
MVAPSSSTPIHLSVHPNPAQDLLMIAHPGGTSAPVRLEVLDARGQVVLNAPIPAGRGGSSVDISTVQAGPYLLRALYPDGGTVCVRFVKI